MNASRSTLVAEVKTRSFLVAFVLLLVTLVHPCHGAITFFDDFNDGDANGWVFPYNSGMTQYPGGSWSVVDGVLKQSTSGDNNAGLVENLIFSDQEIEFRADTDSGYFGVALWYQQVDSTRANYIAISPQLVGYYGVFEFMDGMNKVTHYDIGGFEGGWFSMRVTAESATGTLKVYVDGVHLFTHVASTPYRSGLSGVYSGNAAGYFDNFRVTSGGFPPTSVGVFRPSDGTFYLDKNISGVWDGCGTDSCFQFGQDGDVSLVGDWNGSGTSKVGAFRPSDGTFYLDYNGSGTWEGCTIDRCLKIGMLNDIPIVGDWNGSGTSKVGTFRPSDGTFYLDFNGNGVWEGCATDKCLGIGMTGDIPLVGKW